MKTLEWPSQSPDLNHIEMLWHDLKKAVNTRKHSNVVELQQFCQDEWAKIPPQHSNRHIARYRIGRQQNSWFHLSQQVFQVLKQQNSTRPSHYHHHILLLVWCSFSEMLCYFYARCNGTHTFQKVKMLSRQSTEYFPKSLGDHQDVFWKNWDEPLCSFCSVAVFVLEPCRPYLPSHFLMVELWTLTLTEVSEACSALDVVVGSFVTSWMSHRCALGVILIGRSLLERFTTVPCFRYLWIMALTVVRWSPKALEMAL